jgi:hypothetical protein
MTQDPLDEALSALPQPDVDAWRREHVRRKAHEALGQSAACQGVRCRVAVLEPVLLAVVCCVHLTWAFGTVMAILLR